MISENHTDYFASKMRKIPVELLSFDVTVHLISTLTSFSFCYWAHVILPLNYETILRLYDVKIKKIS